MDIQLDLESAIHDLISEFLQEPYRFFTEADAVARFHQILESNSLFDQKAKTLDGVLTPLVHQEYPTFFRFDDKNPIARLDKDSKAKRGHYDVVILNPDFVEAHNADVVKNRNILFTRNTSIVPLQAVIEFKLDDRGWTNGRRKGAIAELGKLVLSKEEVEHRYLVVLMRYGAPNQNRWNLHWPAVKQAAEKLEIRSIFVTHWITTAHSKQVEFFGNWHDKYI